MKFKMTRRQFLNTSAVVALPLAAPAIAKAASGSGSVVVHFGGGAMGEAQRIAFSEPFTEETGIAVVHQPGVSAGVQRAATLAGAPKHDVANISGGSISSFVQDNLLIPIDYSLWAKQDIDAFEVVPTAKFHSPAMLYSMVIAYDKARYAKAPQGWADVWNVENFPGPRSLAAGTNAADGCTYEIALLADGVAPEHLYPIDWERAFASLARIRKDIAKWWANGAESVQLQLDRQISLGSAWNGRIDGANDEGGAIGKSWNQAIMQWSSWAIPKGARNIDNAQKYIAFMSRPETQAKFSEIITYGPTNAKAFDHIPAERASQLPTAPELRKLQFVQNYDFWNATDATGQTGLARAVSEWEKWITAQ
jgi:putative spermidine/putrescine transport system substrate-binding protein